VCAVLPGHLLYIFTHFLYAKDHLASHFWFNLKIINFYAIGVRQPNLSSVAQPNCLFHLGPACPGNLFWTELKSDGFWCHKPITHPLRYACFPLLWNFKIMIFMDSCIAAPSSIFISLYCGSDDKCYNIWCLGTWLAKKLNNSFEEDVIYSACKA